MDIYGGKRILYILLIIMGMSSWVLADWDTVRIGAINPHYKNMINKSELTDILKEIQGTFKSTLNVDVFGIDMARGKPIDLIYLAPNKVERRIANLKRTLSLKSKVINKITHKVRLTRLDVMRYNRVSRQYKRMQRNLEVLAKSSPQKLGAAIGYTKDITLITNGVKRKSKRKYMDKIEIYHFKSKDELKAILAHEILHLVGLDHISTKGALMNPYIQKGQVLNLHLTKEDVENFKRGY